MDTIDLPDVRVVITPRDLQRVGRFRYSVYIEEQGKAAKHLDHDAGTLIEPEDRDWNSRVYFAELDGKVLGTMRAQRGPFPGDLAAAMSLDKLSFCGQQNLVLFSRLMVAREARHTDVAGKIFMAGFLIAPIYELAAGVLTCTPSLNPFFETLGCAAYAAPFVHEEAGLQQPMAVLPESQYLRQRGSPLGNLVSTYKPDSPLSADFLELIESYRSQAGKESLRKASRLSTNPTPSEAAA